MHAREVHEHSSHANPLKGVRVMVAFDLAKWSEIALFHMVLQI